MLKVISGDNYDAVHNQIEVFLREFSGSKNINPEYISGEDFDMGKISQLSSGAGLFGATETLIISGVLQQNDIAEFVIKKISDLAQSPNLFIFVEEKITKKTLDNFKKAQAEIKNFSLPKKKDTTKFNVFSLTDALGVRDKKKLWILYQQALQAGVEAEEIHGILWWQLKNLLLVAKEKTNPGLHPFVYGKTQKFVKQFSKGELENLSHRIVKIFHEARRGKASLVRETEKFILAL